MLSNAKQSAVKTFARHINSQIKNRFRFLQNIGTIMSAPFERAHTHRVALGHVDQ